MQNDIKNLSEKELYEYIKSLSDDDRQKVLENLLNQIDYSCLDLITKLDSVTKKLEEDYRYRELFYWELYDLIDRYNDLTELGEFYKNLYRYHFIKAIKIYKNFSKSMIEKNRVFHKNEKAYEYLMHFKSFVKNNENPEKVLKKTK